MAHTSLALYELFSNRHDDAIRRLHRAIALDPNSSFARGNLGVAYSFGGEPDRSLAALEEAMRLSPRDFLMVIWHTASAWSQLHAEMPLSRRRGQSGAPLSGPDASVASGFLGLVGRSSAWLAGAGLRRRPRCRHRLSIFRRRQRAIAGARGGPSTARTSGDCGHRSPSITRTPTLGQTQPSLQRALNLLVRLGSGLGAN